jgi:hypothetical protein
MTSDAEIIIAFLYKRSGKEELGFSDLYLNLSMELNWFTPADAKAFVNTSIKQKLLIEKGDLIKPNFDINKIVVPVGFIPSRNIFEKKEVKVIEDEDFFKKIIRQIADKTKLDEKQIIGKIEDIAKAREITKEVAALLLGKDHNILFKEFYEEIEERIVKSLL